MQLFYTPGLANQTYELSEEESRHCSQVLRLKTGDRIFCTNGEGKIYQAEINETGKKKTTINIIELYREDGKKNFYLHIAIAPTKNSDRYEWFLEKAVEIGVDEITPLICDHSERKTVNHDRSNKIVISAMKQSLKSWLPKLNHPLNFNDFVTSNNDIEKYIAYCGKEKATLLKDIYRKNSNVLVLIGPEGDFSYTEAEFAENNGFAYVSLGDSRLRTETAGVFVCSMINIINQ